VTQATTTVTAPSAQERAKELLVGFMRILSGDDPNRMRVECERYIADPFTTFAEWRDVISAPQLDLADYRDVMDGLCR
jgi:hypothetical protein